MDFVTIKYDATDNIKMTLYYDNNGGKEKPTALELDNYGGIFVTGVTRNPADVSYVTVKYTECEKDFTISSDQTLPRHLANELIIKFNPGDVNPAFVNDKQRRFSSKLEDVISIDVINNMSEKLGLDLTREREVKIIKIFTRMTTADSISVSRLGNTIRMPEFWSTFVLKLPAEIDLSDAMDSLSLIPADIRYAHLNFVGELHTNDPFYETLQADLHPTTSFPNAHINVESAWQIENGQSNTKIGILDGPAKWSHEDFGDGSWAGSKFSGGWDFWENTSITSTTTFSRHGTQMSGLIGALRNNGTGIAGVAGGNVDVDGSPNTGVQLFSLSIRNNGAPGGGEVPFSIFSDAVVEGSTYNPDTGYGYGLHIMSASLGFRIDEDFWSPNEIFTSANATLLTQAYETSYRNNCISVASRGNDGNDDIYYPAGVGDPWIITVSASGTNGEYISEDANNTGLSNYSASYGEDVDVIAPGSRSLSIAPTESLFSFMNCNPNPTSNSEYDCISGTSSATALTSGVIGLMYSLHNIDNGYPNNLALEDVEYILENYATDIAEPDYPVGYDIFNGWGRVDARACLDAINLPEYYIYHSESPSSTATFTESQTQQISIPTGFGSLSAGNYNAIKITKYFTYHVSFDAGWSILDGWARTSSAFGTSPDNPVSGAYWESFEYDAMQNTATVTTSTHTWLISSASNGQAINLYLPVLPDDMAAPFSLHLCYPGISSATKNQENDNSVKVFPNPASEYATIEYNLPSNPKQINVQILDLTGNLLFEKIQTDANKNSVTIDLKDYSNGVYICKIVTENHLYSEKIIKFGN